MRSAPLVGRPVSGDAWRSGLYLSLVTCYVPDDGNKPTSSRRRPQALSKSNNPLYWLMADNRDLAELSFPPKTQEGDAGIPVFPDGSSQLALRLLHGRRNQLANVDILLYVHESVEASGSVLPALKVKNVLEMKHCLPFSLGFQGSLANLAAVEIAEAFFRAEPIKQVLIVSVDCIVPPFSRRRHDLFPKGDSGAAVLYTVDDGDYRVNGYRVNPYCLKTPPHKWTQLDCQVIVQQLLRLTVRLLEQLSQCGQLPDWLVPQHLSFPFGLALKQVGERYGVRVKLRECWGAVNLLGSDPFVTLVQMEQNGEISRGQSVLLLWASIDHGLGAMLLERVR
ncbi:MAG: hypothetical protein H0Z34_03510 [Brevibacillus sp.]|nr:hypothetical protein [Brevibacillus sp.]